MEDGEKLELYLSALTHCLDPHSSYMSPQTRDEFRISMELRLRRDRRGAAAGGWLHRRARRSFPAEPPKRTGGSRSATRSSASTARATADPVRRRDEAHQGRALDPRPARDESPPAGQDGRAHRSQGPLEEPQEHGQRLHAHPADDRVHRTRKSKARSSRPARGSRTTHVISASASSTSRRSIATSTAPPTANEDFKSTAKDVQKVLDEFRKQGRHRPAGRRPAEQRRRRVERSHRRLRACSSNRAPSCR